VGNYLAAADFFVTASTSEVHPLTVIEAMAAGLPVAAPAAPGLVDSVVAGKTGYLTGSPENGLAAAMVALAVDLGQCRRMGQAAREEACRRYDVNRTVALTLELYERLLKTRPDLKRRREHGRWARRNEKLDPLLDQLGRLLRPPEWMEGRRMKTEG
jgi:glycosyltransferase involved in cell wall biosynthesis